MTRKNPVILCKYNIHWQGQMLLSKHADLCSKLAQKHQIND